MKDNSSVSWVIISATASSRVVANFVVKLLKHPAKNLGPILGPSKNMY